MTKTFTGRHITVILLAFFGVVIAVNMLMATLAARTFGGVVVENSYVASQQFNGWIAAARAQERLGWDAKLGVDDERRVTVATRLEAPLVTGFAEHPLGRLPDVPLSFTTSADEMVSTRPLPPGRWTVHVRIRHGGKEARLSETLS